MASENHYVDNKKLFNVLVRYKNAVTKAKAKKSKRMPPIPEYVGECLLKIATRLSHKANFASYTFRDDMISDAIENCITYMHNFDPKKSSNPFAYFTQITHYAFIRRIEREKKHVYTKYKYAMHKAQQQEDYTTLDGESVDIKDPSWMSYENVHDFIRDYEYKLGTSRTRTIAEDDVASFDILEEETDIEHERGLDGEIERLSDDDEDEAEGDNNNEE